MFSIINSLSLPVYLFLLLCIVVTCIIGLIQWKKSSKKYWKGWKYWYYATIVYTIVLGVNRVIHHTDLFAREYGQVSTVITIALLILYILAFIISCGVLLVKNQREHKE